MTELAIREQHLPALAEKIEYAKFLAAADLLPKAYQDKPANLLWAIEYGAMLGLPPMAAITGIHIIEGRPTMSAGLMAAKVREAGHKIRVQSTGEGDQAKARCTIRRSDDPDFEYSATWTMARAKQADLLGKANWRRHPVQMLKNRAISEACRDACQEVLLGVHYTPDELGAPDDGGELVDDGYRTLPDGRLDQTQMTEAEKDAAGLMTRPDRIAHDALRRDGEPAPGAVQKTREADPGDLWYADPETPAVPPESMPAPSPAAPQDTTSAPHRNQAGKPALDRLTKAFGQLQLDEAEQDTVISWLGGLQWTASTTQVRMVASALENFLETADGDVASARDALWAQYRTAQEASGG